jgi:GNAT superfamily N-acetyltransferase
MTSELTERLNVTDGADEPLVLAGGYRLRAGRLDDVPAVSAVANAHLRALLGREGSRPEYLRRDWEVPGFDPARDTRVVEAPDGGLAAFVCVWDISEPHVRLGSWGRVHPQHQGRGLGSALLQWAEARARLAIPRAPAGARVSLQQGSQSVDHAAHACFGAARWQPVRYFWRMAIEMDAPPPAPVWPEGVRVRSADAAEMDRDLRLAVIAVRESFRDHWGYIERPLEQELKFWKHFMADNPDFDPSLQFMAEDGDEVAGVSLCWPESEDDPEMGWVGTLGVLRPWRRRGLGLALLLHSFGEFYRRGKRQVGLGVDAASLTGATRLYERAGMHVAEEHHQYELELRPGEDLSTQSVE